MRYILNINDSVICSDELEDILHEVDEITLFHATTMAEITKLSKEHYFSILIIQENPRHNIHKIYYQLLPYKL